MSQETYIVIWRDAEEIFVDEIRTHAALVGKLSPDSHGNTEWGKAAQCRTFKEWNATTDDAILVLRATVLGPGDVEGLDAEPPSAAPGVEDVAPKVKPKGKGKKK